MRPPLTQEERESFRRYAEENATESDGSQCQWADYSIRLLDEDERLFQEWERMRDERAAALNVKSRDGLLSSEWLLRTGLAERDRDTAEMLAAKAALDNQELREKLERAEERVRGLEAELRAVLCESPGTSENGGGE